MTVAARPSIPGVTYASRLGRAGEVAAGARFDALLIGVGPDLRYLTGYEAMPLERLTMLVVPSSGPPTIVVPRLERSAAEAGLRTEVAIETWEETDNPYATVGRIIGTAPGGSDGRRFGVSATLWAVHLLGLQATLPPARYEPATAVTRTLRMVKDPDEIALLRLAAQAADRVVEQIATGPLVGRTEHDVADEVRRRLLAEGHELAAFAIVASGPNSASPHHEASDRVIQAGEPIVLDIGGALGGYGSDITRTLWVTGGDPGRGPDDEFRHLFGVLRTAQERATAAVRPGVSCEAIDAAARELIDAEGYGGAFFHRTGHGIGLEEHEEPYLIAGNTEPLAEGMAFSVEPGIYLVGRYGARIEDIVVCGANGPDTLNEASRDLWVVPG